MITEHHGLIPFLEKIGLLQDSGTEIPGLYQCLESLGVAVFEHLGYDHGFSFLQQVLLRQPGQQISIDFARNLLSMFLERERASEASKLITDLPEDVQYPLNSFFSVVMITKNRGESIRPTLQHLKRLVFPPIQFEIIVVDNGSSDSTKDIAAEELADAPCATKIVVEPKGRICSARNAGIRAAKGNWIGFIDDDAICNPDWLLHYLLALLSFSEAGAMGGPSRLPTDLNVPLWWNEHCGQLVSCQDRHTRIQKTSLWEFPFGLNMFIGRSALDMVGFFDKRLDPHCLYDETELFFRIHDAGSDIIYVPGAVVTHCLSRDRLKFTNLLRRSFLIGRARWTFEQMHPGKVRLHVSPWRFPLHLLAVSFREPLFLALPLELSKFAGEIYQRMLLISERITLGRSAS